MRRAALVAAAAVGSLVAGCGAQQPAADGPAVISDVTGDEGPYDGIELDAPYRLPALTFTDADDGQVALPDDLDRPVRVFFFGYTQCPDVCPLVMSDLAMAVNRLPADVADQVQVVLVTSDPARDDPAALRAYLDRFDPDFTGLTGDLADVVTLASAMGVPIEEGERLPSGGYEVAHGASVVAYVGDQGVLVWPEGTSAEALAEDMTRLVGTADDGTAEEDQ